MNTDYVKGATMTEYTPAGIVHHGESITRGPGGTLVHTYWDKCQDRYIREMLTQEEFEQAIKEDWE